jgi:hypothetical protein
MQSITPALYRIASVFAPALIVSLLFCATANAQYFPLPGPLFYAGTRTSHQVFDVSPDGKIAIALRNDPHAVHPALITTFHPILGTQFDSKTFGFGPLEVRLAQVGNSLRAIVLTSEGGPRRIYLFDVAADGKLTQIASTQLTTSIADAGSNIVLSGSGSVGFTIVDSTTTRELVTFSLTDGSILKRTTLAFLPTALAMYEAPGKRLLAFRSDNQFKVFDALDPANPQEIASVPLVANNEFSALPDDSIAFSSDGRFVFFASQFFNFAAIDLNTKSIVGTIAGNFRFWRIVSYDDGQRRLLAALSLPAGTGGTSALLLVDATNPAQLTILNSITPIARTFFSFSSNGSRLYVQDAARLTAYNLPNFSKIWEQPVTAQSPDAFQLRVYGPDDEILGAWQVAGGFGFTSMFGAFPANPPHVSLSNSVSVAEAVGPTGVTFTVSLSEPTSHRVTVNYSTADVNTQNGMDYNPVFGALTFEPGQVLSSLGVALIDDSLDEFDEKFNVNISPNVGILQQGQSTVTILDDDAPPQLAIADTNTIEGTNVGRALGFLVGMSMPSGKPVTVTYATADGTATGSDYISAGGTVTLLPGQTLANITVQGKADRLSESNETILVNLTAAGNATLVDNQAVGTILDDDPAVLATELNSQRAIALDAVTFVQEPFGIDNPNYFGTDKRSRIALFTTNLIHTPDLIVTAQAVDDQQVVYPLTVEFVGTVPSFIPVLPEAPFLTQIIVKLPDGITSPRDLQINVTTRGRISNKVLIAVKP